MAPPTVVVLLLLAAPVLLLAWNSLTSAPPGQVGRPPMSVANYLELLADPRNLWIMGRTAALAAAATTLACVIAIPIAMVVVFTPSRVIRTIYMIAAISPLLISVVMRTFGWQVLLGAGGPIAETLTALFGAQWLRGLLGTDVSTVVGMAHQMVPFVLLSLIPTLDKLDTNAVRAAENLGASGTRIFWKVVLPLARPGLLAGAVISMALGLTAFVTPTLLGGRQLPVFSMVVYDLNFRFFDWSRGAAAATILLVVVVLTTAVVSRIGRLRRRRQPADRSPTVSETDSRDSEPAPLHATR